MQTKHAKSESDAAKLAKALSKEPGKPFRIKKSSKQVTGAMKKLGNGKSTQMVRMLLLADKLSMAGAGYTESIRPSLDIPEQLKHTSYPRAVTDTDRLHYPARPSNLRIAVMVLVLTAAAAIVCAGFYLVGQYHALGIVCSQAAQASVRLAGCI